VHHLPHTARNFFNKKQVNRINRTENKQEAATTSTLK